MFRYGTYMHDDLENSRNDPLLSAAYDNHVKPFVHSYPKGFKEVLKIGAEEENVAILEDVFQVQFYQEFYKCKIIYVPGADHVERG